MNEIKSFSEIIGFDYFEQQKQQIKNDIDSKPKEYLLGVDENEYKQFLFDKFKLEALTIDLTQEDMGEPLRGKITLTDQFRGNKYEKEAFTFNVKYPFTGSPILFQIRPSTWTMTSEPIIVSDISNTVGFKLVTHQLDPVQFQMQKDQKKDSAFKNLSHINTDAHRWNGELPGIITRFYAAAKAKYENENEFFKAINLKVNSNKNNVFSAPTIQKKTIVQPTVSKKTEFNSEPAMAREVYNDIIQKIYSAGKTMEKKPSLYEGKDEEGLRDQFLFVLENAYDGTTSTGETFNKNGKTDIMLKYAKDGTNLFIAECKFWKGASEFHKAISQLFDNYLTWRDSKVAVMIFVKNNDFTAVLKTIKEEARKHKNYLRENGSHGESSYSYIFNLPQDADKEVFLEVIAFHFHE